MTNEVPAEQVSNIEQELAEYKDKYFRALAEIENTRKRLQKEKIESQSYAIQEVILEFLQPMDHFEQALHASESASSEVKHWAVGFKMILEQLKQVVEGSGVTHFQAVGQPFDPHLHEAIETEETTEQPEGIVLKEFARGYKLGSRVIRPAKVKVAVAPSTNS